MEYRIRMIAAACAAGFALTAAAAQGTGDSQSQVTPSRAVGRTHTCAQYYPALSTRLNETGTVQIRYDVQADGTIDNVTVAQSSGSGRLDRAAVDCVSHSWRNTPARLRGIAVPSPGHIANIQFLLHDDAPQLYATPPTAPAPATASAAAPAATPGAQDTGDTDALDFVLRYGGALAIAAWIVIALRRWIFRARTCPSCAAPNRGIVPFVLPGYCSSCGTKFEPLGRQRRRPKRRS